MLKYLLAFELITSVVVCLRISGNMDAETTKASLDVGACQISCPAGSEPKCTNTSRFCNQCQDGWFSVGNSAPCRPCQHCRVGYGRALGCTRVSDTVCNKCIPGETYSDTYNQESCYLCSDCLTEVKSLCTVTQDTVCSLDLKCPLGKYRNVAAGVCLFCSKYTEGAETVPDCKREGVPAQFQFAYNPINPRPYIAPTGSSSVWSSPSKFSLDSETNVALAIPMSSSFATAAVMIILGIVVVCYYKRRRHYSLPMVNTSSLPVTGESEHEHGLATIGPADPVKSLPKKTKEKLASQFMLRGRRQVYYLILADKFNFTVDERNELELYCQQAKRHLFADKLFEFMETKTPQASLGDLTTIFEQEDRLDLVTQLKEWLYEEKVLFDNKENETTSLIVSNTQSSPVATSAHIIINRSDNDHLLDENSSCHSANCDLPLPDSPPRDLNSIGSSSESETSPYRKD